MTTEFVATVVLLLILLDPLGNIPLLISLLRPLEPARRQHVVLRENAVAAVLLIVFVFIGDWLLAALRLSAPALEISGGLILFLIAVPMIAGPAALATVLLTSRQEPLVMSLFGAILVAIVLNTLILLAAERLARLFGKPGLAAMERLMGLVLTTMAVQMLISGIKGAFLLPAAA